MDSYHPSKMNRYWKRPKLRVYDCNVRDAERFYQDSYKHYLSEKEEAVRRAARARSIDSNRVATEFYPHLLAGSFKREARDDIARQINLPPLPPALADAAKSRWESDHKVPETSFTARQEGLADFDPRDTASIEERYQKLRRLREELNLPAEGAESSALGSLRSGSVGIGGSGGGGYGTEKNSYMSEQSSRTLAPAGGSDDASSYSFRSERMARMNGNAGGGEGYRYKTDTSTSEYKRGGDQNSYDYKMRSERGGDQNSSEYRFRSERGAAGDQNSYDYKLRSERGGDQNSLEYKPRSERAGAGEQNTYEYRLRSDRGGGDQNSYEYKSRSERGGGGDQNSYEYKPRSERGTGEVTSTDYKFRSERGGDSSDYKSRFELKTDDYKLPSKAVDFDLPKIDRKKDDYSFSSSADKKTDRYSSLSSTAATSASASASASTEKKSLASTSKDDDKEVDDDNVSDMMKKLPSSQEILERISKMELDD